MIRNKDTNLLAQTKFKQRKGRSLVSGCLVSLGLVTIMTFFIGAKGFSNVVSKLYNLPHEEFYWATEYLPTGYQDIDHDYYKKKYSKNNLVQVYERYETSTIYTLDEDYVNNEYEYMSSGQFSLNFVDEDILEDYLYGDSSLDRITDDTIPIIVPLSYLYNLANVDTNEMTPKEQYEKNQLLLGEFIGTDFNLYITSDYDEYSDYYYHGMNSGESLEDSCTDTNLKVRIVGVFGTSDYFIGSSYSDFILPLWVIEDDKLFSDLSVRKSEVSTTLYYQFASRKDRESLVKYSGSIYQQDTLRQYTEEPIRYIRYIGLGIGAFFLVISTFITFFTVNKIVSESRREIGVYRAVGARKKDVRKIFFRYSLLIMTIGYFIAIIISFVFCSAISMLWGGKLFYLMALAAISFDGNVPLFLFVGLPVLELLAIYLLSIASGYVAAFIPAHRASSMDVVKALRDE